MITPSTMAQAHAISPGRQQKDGAERQIDDSEHPAEKIKAPEHRRRPAARLAGSLEGGSAGKDEQPEGPRRECRAPAPEEPEKHNHSERCTQSTRDGSEDHKDDPSEVERLLGFALAARSFLEG